MCCVQLRHCLQSTALCRPSNLHTGQAPSSLPSIHCTLQALKPPHRPGTLVTAFNPLHSAGPQTSTPARHPRHCLQSTALCKPSNLHTGQAPSSLPSIHCTLPALKPPHRPGTLVTAFNPLHSAGPQTSTPAMHPRHCLQSTALCRPSNLHTIRAADRYGQPQYRNIGAYHHTGQVLTVYQK